MKFFVTQIFHKIVEDLLNLPKYRNWCCATRAVTQVRLNFGFVSYISPVHFTLNFETFKITLENTHYETFFSFLYAC